MFATTTYSMIEENDSTKVRPGNRTIRSDPNLFCECVY